jgi:hypothetical protein
MSNSVYLGSFVTKNGSHPAILSEEAWIVIGSHPLEFPIFETVDKFDTVPSAIVCIYESHYTPGWDIFPISQQTANDIIEKIEGDHFTTEHSYLGKEVMNEVFDMLGYSTHPLAFASVTIIQNPELDTVYFNWSFGQSYWSPPYEKRSIWSLMDIGELKVSGIDFSRIISKMRSKGISG